MPQPSAYDITAIAGSGTVFVGGVVAAIKWWRPWLAKRAIRGRHLDWLLLGKPDDPITGEEGFDPIAVQVRDLKHAVTNGITTNQAQIAADAAEAKDKATQAAQLAGQAAATSARVEQQATEDIARLDEKIDDVQGVVHGQLDRANREAAAMRAIAIELGMPWPDDPAAT